MSVLTLARTRPPSDDGEPYAPLVLLPLSGDDPRAVAEAARATAEQLARAPHRLVDLAYGAGVLTDHGRFRLGGVAAGAGPAAHWLAQVGADGAAVAHEACGPVALVFSGQGNQWLGMGRDLLLRLPEAAATLAEADRVLLGLAGWSLLDQLGAAAGESRLEDAAVLQPVLVALQAALAAQLTRWGVVGDAFVGHSLGELSAAVACGALDLADGLRLAHLRGQLTREAAGTGLTALLGLGEQAAAEQLERFHGAVEAAAWNDPRSTLVSGDADAVGKLVDEAAAAGVFARVLPGTVPFHSRVMEPLQDRLAAAAADIVPYRVDELFVSTVTGAALDTASLDGSYWARNLREPVRFAQAAGELTRRGFQTFVEVGAHPTLTPSLIECGATAGTQVEVVPTLRKHTPDAESLLRAAGRVFELGYSLDWSAIHPGRRRPIRPVRPAAGRPVRLTAPASWLAAQPAPGTDTDGTTDGTTDPNTNTNTDTYTNTATELTFWRFDATPAWRVDRAALLAAPPAERAGLIVEHIRHELAEVLRLPVDRIDPDQPVTQRGLDSIMGMELGRRARAAFGVEVSVPRLLRGPTIAEISGELAEQIAGTDELPGGPAPAGTDLDDVAALEDLLANIDDLPEEEVNALLERLATGTRESDGTH